MNAPRRTDERVVPDHDPEVLDSHLWALTGIQRRAGEEPEKAPPKKKAVGVRLGLQGRLTLVVIGVVLVIMIGVAFLELRAGMAKVILAGGKEIDLTNLETFAQQYQAIAFLLRTPVIAMVAAGFLLLFYTSRYVVGPLRSVGETADAITGGDLTRRMEYPVNDEIGDVVMSFNVMTRSLVRKMDQLASLNQAGNAFSRHLSLEELSETIRENVREHVRPSVVGLFTTDNADDRKGRPDSEDLVRARARSEIPDRLAETQSLLARRAFETEQVGVLCHGDPHILSADNWVGDRPIEGLGFPLFAAGQAFGALAVTVERGTDYFTRDDLEFMKVLASHVSVAAKNAQLYRSLEISYLDTVAALAAAVDAKDAYTRGHSERVMRNAVNVARAIGLPRAEVEMIRYSALLHDVGKIGLPTHILSTKQKLTPEEFDLVKQHPVIGYEIVRPITFLRAALDGIRYHHERWDGKGYPDGLAGIDIPFMARILCLADTWDAMAHDRFYRQARSTEEIVQEFIRCNGTQFDPELVPTAIEILPQVTAEDSDTGSSEEETR